MYIKNNRICDEEGRTLIPRGCNVGGSSKVPVDGTRGSVTYVGKPFPLEEAEERFAELKRWGLYFNRLVVPWEALEHEGPGIYDEAYLAYLRKILLAAQKQGVYLWIDPHQDVWGRAAGGDGAPAWTLEALGIDTNLLETAGASLALNEPAPPDKRPPMIWPAGYNRYAAATMFTLFFAGNVYAPNVYINSSASVGSGSQTVQDWLQQRYIEAFAHCRRRLKNCAAIAGWGTMNEPHPGFIGYSNLDNLENNLTAIGAMPSAFAAMVSASGYSVEVPLYSTGINGIRKKGTELLNPRGVSIFKDGFTCPWKTSGVWNEGAQGPQLLKPEYFARYNGRRVRFSEDFLAPFMTRFINRLYQSDEKTFFFVEGVPSGLGTGNDSALILRGNEGQAINGFHWYDGATLFLKKWRSWFNYNIKTKKIVLGKKAVEALFREQIEGHRMPYMPNMLGEFGIPFDLNKGKAFSNGNYAAQEEALDMYYDALDDLLMGACIWNYSADNDFRHGDSWNNEDFSIVTSGYNKGQPQPRAMGGWLRPYPLATAGSPISFKWNRKKKTLHYRYRADPQLKVPTVLFIPSGIWDDAPNSESGFSVLAEAASAARPEERDGISTEYRLAEQLLLVYHNGFGGEIVVKGC
jgi:hypothetical protein